MTALTAAICHPKLTSKLIKISHFARKKPPKENPKDMTRIDAQAATFALDGSV
jgi:hypothetical protein